MTGKKKNKQTTIMASVVVIVILLGVAIYFMNQPKTVLTGTTYYVNIVNPPSIGNSGYQLISVGGYDAQGYTIQFAHATGNNPAPVDWVIGSHDNVVLGNATFTVISYSVPNQSVTLAQIS